MIADNIDHEICLWYKKLNISTQKHHSIEEISNIGLETWISKLEIENTKKLTIVL